MSERIPGHTTMQHSQRAVFSANVLKNRIIVQVELFGGPEDGNVDHFVVAARSTGENFYRQRIVISQSGNSQGTNNTLSAPTLGFNPGDSFFISVAAVDRRGHESLFAYPEVRCDATTCAIPANAFNVTAPLPPPPPATDDVDEN